MQIIPLTQGQVAVVDDADFERFGHLEWYANWSAGTRSFYARRNAYENGKQRPEYLARVIMNSPVGMMVDHRNHDTLDCRRSNLRVVTCAQNQMNRIRANGRRPKNLIGVSWHKHSRKWQVRVTVARKEKCIGMFSDVNVAIAARKAASREVYGEYGGRF